MPKILKVILPYRVAHLSIGKSWEIIYYLYNNKTCKYDRYRIRINSQIKHFKSHLEKMEHANQLVKETNNQLILKFGLKNVLSGNSNSQNHQESYESFAIENNNKDERLIIDLLNDFLSDKELSYKRKELRGPTYQTYTARVKSLTRFSNEYNYDKKSISEFNNNFIKQYSDYLFHKKKLTAVYHNNSMAFLKSFHKWLKLMDIVIDLDYNLIPKKKEGDKIRQPINKEWRLRIVNHLRVANPAYLTLCMFTYYTFIRARELTHLKVKHINILNRTIRLDDDFSKNNKTELVTIPNALIPYIKILNLDKHSENDYIFSQKDFMPGPTKMNSSRINSIWVKMRKAIGTPVEYQWYSLKDSGIEALLQKGVPLLEVQRQCRHHNINITQKYFKKTISKASEYIQNSDVKFL